MEEENQPTHEQDFDGVRFSPQFSIALKDFIRKNFNLPKARSGVASSVPGSSTNYAIAHGLGAVPTFVSVSGYAVGGALGFVVPYLSQSAGGTAPDATNIYVNISNNAACSVAWYAATL